jgi:hypothetical protein
MPLVHCVRHQTKPSKSSGFGCLLLSSVEPETDVLAVDLNLSGPLLVVFSPRDSSKPRRSPRTSRLVLTVSVARDFSKVSPPIVKAVSVDVISYQSITVNEPQDFTMKTKCPLPTLLVFPSVNISVGPQAPMPTVDKFSIGSVHERVGSNRTVSGSQGDTYGILKAHREASLLGVTPPVVDATRGYSCV